jgi:uncharacterized protein YdaU (DUF1376 family)
MIEQVAEDGHLGAMAGINVPALRDTAVTEEALSPVPEAAHPRPKTTARPEAEASAHPSQETAPPKPEVHPLPSEPSAPAVPEPVPGSIHEAARVRPVEKAQPAEQPVPKTPAAIPQQPQEAAVTQPEAVPQPVNKTARPDVAPLLTEQTTPEEVIAARQRTAAAVSRDTSAGEETPPEAETEDGPAGADLDLHRLVVENLRQAQQSQPRRAGRSLLWVLALLLVGGAAGGGWATRDRWVEPARVRMQDFSVLAATAGHELAIAGKAAAVQVSALLARAGQALQTLQQSGPAAPVAAGDHDKPDAQDEPVPAAAVPVTAEPEPQPSSDGQNRVQEPGTMAETQTLRANDTPNTRHTVPPEPVPATDGSVAGIAVVPVSAETQTAELKQQAEQLEQLRLNAEKLAREREAAERRLAQEQAARKAAERRARIERERLQTAQAAARRAREERQLQEAAAARAAAAQQPAPARQSAVVAAPVVLPVAGTETVSAPVVAEAPLQPAAAASRSSVAVPAETRAAVAEKEKVEFSIDPCNGPKARFMSTCR